MPELSDKDKQELKTSTADVELEDKPSDREVEFEKITEIVKSIRTDFLESEEMSIEDALKKIQDELTKMAPEEEEGEDDFEKLLNLRGPSLSSLGQPPMGPPGGQPPSPQIPRGGM